MARVFVSYRWEDSPGHAGRIYDRLEREFDDVYRDVDRPQVGAPVASVVEAQLANCDAFVAVVGPGWEGDGSDGWARRELADALARGIRVVVALVAGVQRHQLPPGLRSLDVPELVELPESYWAEGMTRVVAAVREALDERPLVPQQQAVARSLAAGSLTVVVEDPESLHDMLDDSAPVRDTLAALPALLREKGYDPSLLVVGVGGGDRLETAFREAGEEVRVVEEDEAFVGALQAVDLFTPGSAPHLSFGPRPSTTIVRLAGGRRRAGLEELELPLARSRQRTRSLVGSTLETSLMLRLMSSDLLYLGVRPGQAGRAGELPGYRSLVGEPSARWVVGVPSLAAQPWIERGAEHVDADLRAYVRGLLRQVEALPPAA